MADLTGLTTNYFATPKEGFTTTLASTISSGATTVPLNSITGYTNGAIATMVVEPTSTTAKQVFTGAVDTAGIQLTSVRWTEGTNQSHAAGSTVVDYVTATHMAALVKGLTTSALDQDGTLKAGAVDNSAALANAIVTVPKLTTELQKGWEDSYGTTTFPTPNTVTYNGNGSYDMVFNSVDLTSSVSNGMRFKCTRTVTAPTQCTSLNGTTQYWSRASGSVTGMGGTDDYTISAWVKLSSYAVGTIASKYNGTSGWTLDINASGQVQFAGFNGGVGNNRNSLTYQSVPLNKWVHIAATLDMSGWTTTTVKTMINGVDVPVLLLSNGTNPTSWANAGNLEIGSRNGGLQPFPGKIAQVAIFSASITQSTHRGYISQGLSGSETSLISAYSFNNSINDLNTGNANNLSPNGSAVATSADSPFGVQADGTTAGTTEYAIITKTAFSTNTTLTVQVPEGCALPTTGGISAVSYSTQKAPYGMPSSRGRWEVGTVFVLNSNAQSVTAATWKSVMSGGAIITAPIGDWVISWQGSYTYNGGSVTIDLFAGLGTTIDAAADSNLTTGFYPGAAATVFKAAGYREAPINISSSTPYYFNVKATNVSASTMYIDTSSGYFNVRLACAHL